MCVVFLVFVFVFVLSCLQSVLPLVLLLLLLLLLHRCATFLVSTPRAELSRARLFAATMSSAQNT